MKQAYFAQRRRSVEYYTRGGYCKISPKNSKRILDPQGRSESLSPPHKQLYKQLLNELLNYNFKNKKINKNELLFIYKHNNDNYNNVNALKGNSVPLNFMITLTITFIANSKFKDFV